MDDADRQDHNVSEQQELLDEFEVELSDLPPSSRSHYLLLRLTALQKSLHETRQTVFAQTRARATQQSEITEDEFEVEFSELPPSSRSHYQLIWLVALKRRLLASIRGNESERAAPSHRATLPILARRSRRARIGQVLTTFGMCAALLVLLLGNAPDLRNQLAGLLHPPASTPTSVADISTTYSSVQIIHVLTTRTTRVAGHDTPTAFGSLPATCPRGTTLQRFLTSIDPPGLGGGPLWITGFDGPVAILRGLTPSPPDTSLPLGVVKNYWYTTLTLFIQKGYEGSIVLQGGEQNSGETLLFSDPELLNTHFAAYIDLQDPTIQHLLISNGSWEMLSLRIHIPTAGCYYLQANWPTDSWTDYFAAGS
jgi:hypothetical protein